jgi:hypothetical protein
LTGKGRQIGKKKIREEWAEELLKREKTDNAGC